MRSTLVSWISAVALLGPSAHAQLLDPAADEEVEPVERYAVEVILFRYGSSVSTGSEIFVPDEPPAIDEALTFGDARGLAAEGLATSAGDAEAVPTFGDLESVPGDPEPVGANPIVDNEEELMLVELPTSRDIELSVLTPEERTMVDEYEKLTRLGAYEPVLWSGWTQIVREETLTTPIDLRRLGGLPLAYAGELKLYLSRFLHLVVDLSLTEPAQRGDTSPFEPGRDVDGRTIPSRTDALRATPRVAYRIAEDRIVNNGDLRYFDHPKYGLLAKITRLEESPLEPTDEEVLLPATPETESSTLR